MPLELYPLIRQASVDPANIVHINDRTFYVGRLAGNDVVLAMTGIGLVNAAETATAAFEHFRCPFTGAVFSGVAGSKSYIGDVNVPQQWTLDQGTSWLAANDKMLATARAVQTSNQVALAQDVPIGDAACLCPGVDGATPVHLPYVPQLRVGGSGTSADTFGGHAVPCLPGGGDIAGCEPCLAPGSTPTDAANFAANAPSLADPGFFEALLRPPDQTTTTMDAQDEETASVASVARQYHVPFLGIRAVSDGQGDPLNLPGFPWQFFVYRQLAGNNAATVTMAFLRTWAAKRWPV
jgi:nucleoside phosphorylase